jgi:hypothetical protein
MSKVTVTIHSDERSLYSFSFPAKPPLKVLISADMEGIAGSTNRKIDSQPGTRD